jgi:hypothetical protein
MTRSPLLLAAAAAAALALGACGASNDGGGGGAKGAAGRDKAFEGALKFSQCMRQHGIDMPDPQRVGKGGIKLSGGKGVDFRDPKMKAAQSACQKYMQIGGGETVDPAKRAKLQEAALSYARCMRGQGVDMPDPKLAGNGGLTFQVGPGGPKSSDGSGARSGLGANPDSPKFKAADKVCNHFLGDRPGAGPGTEESK